MPQNLSPIMISLLIALIAFLFSFLSFVRTKEVARGLLCLVNMGVIIALILIQIWLELVKLAPHIAR